MMIVEVSLSILWTVPLNRSSFVEVFFWSCALAMTARDRRRNTPTNHAIKLFMRIKFRSFPGYPCALPQDDSLLHRFCDSSHFRAEAHHTAKSLSTRRRWLRQMKKTALGRSDMFSSLACGGG